MARPRVFVSSTFYDLRYARVSLESFIRDMGYDPVLNERGNIPYGTSEDLASYCYAEISKVNILVSIIGGRFGSKSREDANRSISNMELKTAIKLGKQSYVFIESNVHSEYLTYTRNKDKDVNYIHADDKRIREFIDEIYGLTKNNQVFTFSEIPQVIAYLKEQWAGLFEGYLEQRNQEKIAQSFANVEATAQTLNNLVQVLTTKKLSNNIENLQQDALLNSIAIQSHPLLYAMRKELRCTYRVFFTNKFEMFEWIRGARGGSQIDSSSMDEDYLTYVVYIAKEKYFLYVSKNLFDSYDNLRLMLPNEWNSNMLIVEKVQDKKDLDEEIPF